MMLPTIKRQAFWAAIFLLVLGGVLKLSGWSLELGTMALSMMETFAYVCIAAALLDATVVDLKA